MDRIRNIPRNYLIGGGIAIVVIIIVATTLGIVLSQEANGGEGAFEGQPPFPAFGCEAVERSETARRTERSEGAINVERSEEEKLHLCPCPSGQKIVESEIAINTADGVHQADGIRNLPVGGTIISNAIIFKLKRDMPQKLVSGVIDVMFEEQSGGGTIFGGYMLVLNTRGRFSLRKTRGSYQELFGKQTVEGDITDPNPTYAYVCSKYKERIIVSIFYKGQKGWVLTFQADDPFNIGRIVGLSGFKYRNSEIAGVVFENLKQCIHFTP